MSNQENPSSTPPPQSATVPADGESPNPNDPRLVSRRWLLFKAGIALNGFVGLVLAVPILRYFFAPWRKDSSYNSWVSLGACDEFPIGRNAPRLSTRILPPIRGTARRTTLLAMCAAKAASQFSVFAINCAHLGCPVRWFPQSQLFMCPCHGGVYYADGSRASGPPERGLFTYNWKIASGELHIDAGQMPTLSNSAKLVKISAAPGDCSCSG